ncbi:MAG TPA: cytochrome C oxidase subunit IV family protein [Thermoanaerobaculia bacterium]|nr:cytochrome C oxidase subunit IV family protein [Thermoanaerobaculia bacterium]
MSTDTHQIPNYMAIFWWLLGLTIGEIAWAILPHHSELVLAGGIVALAIVKAVLVALYFMHLKFERKTMGVLFASTLILGAILVSVGIAELVLPRPGYTHGVVHGPTAE